MKGAFVRRPWRLRYLLFAFGSLFTLAGAMVTALPAQAHGPGTELNIDVNCDKGLVNFLGTNFDRGSGKIYIQYPPSKEVFQTAWHYNTEGPKTQVIATLTLDQVIKQAGHEPPFEMLAYLKEDPEIMDDDWIEPCTCPSPTPTVTTSPTPTQKPTPTPTQHTPSPGGSVQPSQAQTSPSPSGAVLAESVGLPNTGVPHSTLMTLAGTLIAIGLMLLALSAVVWRRPVSVRA